MLETEPKEPVKDLKKDVFSANPDPDPSEPLRERTTER